MNAATDDRCAALQSCRKQTAQANQLAAQNRFDEALALYEKAYEQSQEPRLLLNIGRCHHRLAQPQKALDRYEEYRHLQASPPPELLSRLNQFIAEAKLAILAAEKEAAKTAVPVEPPPPPPLPPPPPPKWDGKTALGRPLWRVGVGFGAMAVGGVLIGLGAGALSVDGRCVETSISFAGTCAAHPAEDGTRSATVVDGFTAGVPMLVTGAVLLVGGVTLVAVPGRAKKSARLAPAFSRSAAAFSLVFP